LPFDWLFDGRRLRFLVVAQVLDEQNAELAVVDWLSDKRPRMRPGVAWVCDDQTAGSLGVAQPCDDRQPELALSGAPVERRRTGVW